MNRLKDKVAIITGSTSGIGAAMARLFAKEGATVVICGRRERRGNALAQEIKKNGGKAMYHFLDLTQPETITALFADTKEKLGKIDVLVNNAAAIGLPDGTVEEVTLEMWDAIFQSDLRGAFIATREVLPYLKENGGGSIVNIGSMASTGGDLGATAYSAAKAGVDMLTKSVALQYGKQGVRCNCIRPGLIVTPQNEPYLPQFTKEVFLDNVAGTRYGRPEDIANMALFLASDESAYVTGQIFDVDGGISCHVATVAQFRRGESHTWDH